MDTELVQTSSSSRFAAP
ncbi:hypothetical protein VCHC56A1_3188, partial [Vibrio cholerae HC-56A1]